MALCRKNWRNCIISSGDTYSQEITLTPSQSDTDNSMLIPFKVQKNLRRHRVEGGFGDWFGTDRVWGPPPGW